MSLLEKLAVQFKALPNEDEVQTPVGDYRVFTDPNNGKSTWVVRCGTPIQRLPYETRELAIDARNTDYRNRMTSLFRDGWVTVKEYDVNASMDMVIDRPTEVPR